MHLKIHSWGHESIYGEPIASTGTNQTPFGFTGEPTDGNGLVYLRARHYSPALGQFINLDPLEISNRYQYVKSNLINATDPSGLYDWYSFLVEQGDTLTCIAREGGCTGSNIQAFIEVTQKINNLTNPDQIRAGTHLFVPDNLYTGLSNILVTGRQNAGKYCSRGTQTTNVSTSGKNPCAAVNAAQPLNQDKCPAFMRDNNLSSADVVGAATAAGIDPLILGMTVNLEWGSAQSRVNQSYFEREAQAVGADIRTAISQIASVIYNRPEIDLSKQRPYGAGASYGIANTKVRSARYILEKYNTCLADLADSVTRYQDFPYYDYAGGPTKVSYIDYEATAKLLMSDPKAALRISAFYLADRRRQIASDLTALCQSRGASSCYTEAELDALTMVSYNQSWEDFTLPALKTYQTASQLKNAIQRTADTNHAQLTCQQEVTVLNGLTGGCS